MFVFISQHVIENIRVAENERPRLILQAQTEYEQSIKQYEIIINNGTTTARIIKTRLVWLKKYFLFHYNYLFYLLRAEADAQIIKKQYSTDLNIYKQIKAAQGLDNEALLSYLAVRAIAESKNEVNFAMKSPARTSYQSITD